MQLRERSTAAPAVLRRPLRYLDEHTPGGLAGRVVGLVRRVVTEAKEDRLGGLAAEVAFWGVLSVFPTILAMAAALGSLQGLLGGDVAARAEQRVVDLLRTFLTSRADGTVETVRELFREQSGGVVSFGVAAALWSASRGMRAALRAIGEINDLVERRAWLHRTLLALALAVVTPLVTAVALAMVVLGPLLGRGEAVASAWGAGELYVTLWQWLRTPVAFLVLLAWATFFLHVAPHFHRGWRQDLAGGLLTAGLWLVVSLGFRLYLELFGGNAVFGVLGGALVVLLWLYLLSAALLVGAELNAVLSAPTGEDPDAGGSVRGGGDHAPGAPGPAAAHGG